MRRQLRIDPFQIQHRRDLADRVIVRNGVSKAERVEKLPLILVEPTHHCPSPQKIVPQTRNHRSSYASTNFCNKIGTKRTCREACLLAAIGSKAGLLYLTCFSDFLGWATPWL